MWTYKCDRCGAALDPGERCDCQDLYRYEFTTIACAAMRSAIGNEQRKQSRRIKTVSLDDPIPGTDGMTWEDIITEDHLVYSA